MYAGAKYFLESFTESIARENEGDVDCTCFEIGPVETTMNRADDEFVKKVLPYVGRGSVIRIGCFTHEMYIRLREIGIIKGIIDKVIIPKNIL